MELTFPFFSSFKRKCFYKLSYLEKDQVIKQEGDCCSFLWKFNQFSTSFSKRLLITTRSKSKSSKVQLLKNHDGRNALLFWNHCMGVDFKDISESHGHYSLTRSWFQSFQRTHSLQMFELIWILDFKAIYLNLVHHHECTKNGHYLIKGSTFYSTTKKLCPLGIDEAFFRLCFVFNWILSAFVWIHCVKSVFGSY